MNKQTEIDQIKLLTKIHRVQEALAYIKKDGKNQAQNYSYVRESDVVKMVRDAMLKEKLIPVVDIIGDSVRHHRFESDKKTPQTLVTLLIKLSVIDIETGQKLEVTYPGFGGDYGVGDKSVYKAITGANKYALLKMFQIETGDDDPEFDDKDAKQKDFDETKIKMQEMPKHLSDEFHRRMKAGTTSQSDVVAMCRAFKFDWSAIEKIQVATQMSKNVAEDNQADADAHDLGSQYDGMAPNSG